MKTAELAVEGKETYGVFLHPRFAFVFRMLQAVRFLACAGRGAFFHQFSPDRIK